MAGHVEVVPAGGYLHPVNSVLTYSRSLQARMGLQHLMSRKRQAAQHPQPEMPAQRLRTGSNAGGMLLLLVVSMLFQHSILAVWGVLLHCAPQHPANHAGSTL